MASSTAFSCFSSSSLRDNVLDLPDLAGAAGGAGSAALPGMLVTLLEPLDGGERGRFLQESRDTILGMGEREAWVEQENQRRHRFVDLQQ